MDLNMDLAERKLVFIQGALAARDADNQTVISIKEIQDILDRKRFSCLEARVNGYWPIRDMVEPDDVIWVDCSKHFLDTIVNALNEKEK